MQRRLILFGSIVLGLLAYLLVSLAIQTLAPTTLAASAPPSLAPALPAQQSGEVTRIVQVTRVVVVTATPGPVTPVPTCPPCTGAQTAASPVASPDLAAHSILYFDDTSRERGSFYIVKPNVVIAWLFSMGLKSTAFDVPPKSLGPLLTANVTLMMDGGEYASLNSDQRETITSFIRNGGRLFIGGTADGDARILTTELGITGVGGSVREDGWDSKNFDDRIGLMEGVFKFGTFSPINNYSSVQFPILSGDYSHLITFSASNKGEALFAQQAMGKGRLLVSALRVMDLVSGWSSYRSNADNPRFWRNFKDKLLVPFIVGTLQPGSPQTSSLGTSSIQIPAGVTPQQLDRAKQIADQASKRQITKAQANAQLADLAKQVGKEGMAWIVKHVPIYDKTKGWLTFEEYLKTFSAQTGGTGNSRFDQDPVGTAADLMFGDYTADDIVKWFGLK